MESYAGIARTGRVTWVDDGTGPVRLGLTGSRYQASDSDRSDSYATDINEAGQIVGTTGRHDGSNGRGASGWFYDPVLGETTELVFSVRDDGYAFTGPAVLTEDGTVFGLYSLYDGADDLGTRLFAWDQERGFVDLAYRIANLSEDGWDQLTNMIDATGGGLVLGHNVLDSESGQRAFLLVPEPTVCVTLLILAGVCGHRRRSTL